MGHQVRSARQDPGCRDEPKENTEQGVGHAIPEVDPPADHLQSVLI